VLLCGRFVGTEVGLSLVRLSPKLSWTRGPLSTSDCRHGPSSALEHCLCSQFRIALVVEDCDWRLFDAELDTIGDGCDLNALQDAEAEWLRLNERRPQR
jgi:hypothetical protein